MRSDRQRSRGSVSSFFRLAGGLVAVEKHGLGAGKPADPPYQPMIQRLPSSSLVLFVSTCASLKTERFRTELLGTGPSLEHLAMKSDVFRAGQLREQHDQNIGYGSMSVAPKDRSPSDALGKNSTSRREHSEARKVRKGRSSKQLQRHLLRCFSSAVALRNVPSSFLEEYHKAPKRL